MKITGLVLFPALLPVLAAVPAFAERIRASDADAYVGATATVEGRVRVDRMASGEIYLDLDGAGDSAPLSGYISRWNANRFPGIATLDGKIVDITGNISTFRKRPEIFLTDPSQIGAIAAMSASGHVRTWERTFLPIVSRYEIAPHFVQCFPC